MKIAVDAMGGDNAPGEVVRGAVQASREFHLPIVLVGREEMIREELRRAGAGVETLDVENASEVVEMQDAPGVAFRKKKDSSIRVGLNLVADGKASSFVSAGTSASGRWGGHRRPWATVRRGRSSRPKWRRGGPAWPGEPSPGGRRGWTTP